MKSFVIALFAVIMSSPFALANGCNSHDKETVMVCESGQRGMKPLTPVST